MPLCSAPFAGGIFTQPSLQDKTRQVQDHLFVWHLGQPAAGELLEAVESKTKTSCLQTLCFSLVSPLAAFFFFFLLRSLFYFPPVFFGSVF